MVNQDPSQWLPQKEDAQRGGKIAYNRQTSGKNGTGKCATQQDRGPCRVEPWCLHQFNAKKVNYNHQVPTDQVSQQSHQWMAWVRTTHRNSCWNFLATPGCQPKTYSILAHHPTSSPRQKTHGKTPPPEPCTAEFPTSVTDGVGWMSNEAPSRRECQLRHLHNIAPVGGSGKNLQFQRGPIGSNWKTYLVFGIHIHWSHVYKTIRHECHDISIDSCCKTCCMYLMGTQATSKASLLTPHVWITMVPLWRLQWVPINGSLWMLQVFWSRVSSLTGWDVDWDQYQNVESTKHQKKTTDIVYVSFDILYLQLKI